MGARARTAWTDATFLTEPGEHATTVLTDDRGVIVAVGGDELTAHAARVERLGGRVVSAGLWDSHLHWVGLAEAGLRLDLTTVASLEALYRRVAEAVETKPRGQMVVGAGWNQNRWGGQLPDLAGLDRVAPAHPVVLWARDHHGLVANSAAYRELFGGEDPQDPLGGRYDRVQGRLTGMAREKAADELWSRVPPLRPDEVARALPPVRQRLAALGLVGATGMEPGRWLEVLAAGFREGGFRTQIFSTEASDEVREWLSRPDPEAAAWFRLVGYKLFADGALGTRTAAVSAPYADTGGTGVWRQPVGELAAAVEALAAGGAAALAVHAIGDAAVSAATAMLARAPAAVSGVRHRVEHAQLVMPDDIPAVAAAGLVASMQPVHLLDDRWAMTQAGVHWQAIGFPLASLAAAGVPLLLGSDAPVETPDPVLGMQAAVWRGREGEDAWHPEEAITPWQALAGYTSGPAAADRRHGGRITPGAWADFTVYDRDPLGALTHHEPFGVVGTVVASRWTYRRF